MSQVGTRTTLRVQSSSYSSQYVQCGSGTVGQAGISQPAVASCDFRFEARQRVIMELVLGDDIKQCEIIDNPSISLGPSQILVRVAKCAFTANVMSCTLWYLCCVSEYMIVHYIFIFND